MAEIHPTDNYNEEHHRGSVLNDFYSVGADGTGRYPGFEWAHLLRQSGWNRGSYKGSRPLHRQGMGVFFNVYLWAPNAFVYHLDQIGSSQVRLTNLAYGKEGEIV